MTSIKQLVLSSLFSALSLGLSTAAFAGVDVTPSLTGSCYQSGGTEVCYGSMAGIRNQTSDYGRSAVFGYNSAGVSYFYMTVNGTSYFCYAPSSLNDTIKTAMASPGYFQVQYTISTGTCTYIAVESGSSERNASAL